jgi:ribosome-associated protein
MLRVDDKTMTEFEDEYDDDEKSKSQVKRELQALRDLGKSLIALPLKDLNKMDLSERLFDAVIKAQSMSHGAFKREVGFIGRIIADEDFDAIAVNFAKLKQVHHGEVKQFHQLEQWRDDLLAGDNEIMTELHQQFSNFDSQYVRQLVRNAKKEAEQTKPAKSARLLFKYLQQCQAENDDR